MTTQLRAIAHIKSVFQARGFERLEHLGRLLHVVEDTPDDSYIDTVASTSCAARPNCERGAEP